MVMEETSFYESFSVATIEKPEDGEKQKFNMRKGLFIAGEFLSKVPDRIHVLPKAGSYEHAIYGRVVVTRERNQEFVDNFHAEVYQKLIPIDLEHETFLSGAVAYYEPGSGLVEMDGSVTIGVRWEERGARALNEGRFYYFSPMWFDKWKEPLSGKIYNNVLIGGALTTNPYFKDANLRPLYASELSVSQVHIEGPVDNEKEEKEASSKCADCGATMSSKECSACKKKASEPEKETNVTEEKKETVPAVPVVDPAQFSEMQSKFAEMQAKMAAQEAELKVANEQIVKSANEARQRRFREVITGTSPEADGARAFRGDPVVHASVLDMIYHVEGPEGADKEGSVFNMYIAEMRGLAEQFADNELLKTRGSGSPSKASGSATEKWNAAVAKAMSDNPKLKETEAYQVVAKAQPVLYREQMSENYAKKGNDD